MGCDIHFHQEVKLNGRWHHHSKREIIRNYTLFALMGNVRNEDQGIEPVMFPNHFPDDATELTRLYKERQSGHSHTCVYLEKIREIVQAVKLHKIVEQMGHPPFMNNFQEMVLWGYLFGNSWEDLHNHPECYPEELEDARWIYWFDN